MAGSTPAKKRSLYEILGVERDANAIDIGMAYKQRLAELNRAANPDPNELGLVREAYHILCQPREREAYDASLVTREEKAAAASQETDLILEADEPEEEKKLPWIWIAAGVAVLATLLFVVMRQTTGPEPAVATAPVAAEPEAPQPPPPPPPPKARSAQEVFAMGAPSVAQMVGYEISGRAVPIGSGVIVAADAIISTCHALPPSGTIVARVGAEEVPASLVITDEDLNLCRFSIVRVSASPAVATAEDLKAGDKVVAVANHAGKALSAVEGTVKGYKTVGSQRLLEISMPVSATANGGALFDSYGRLVGILTNRQRAGGPANAALPASAIGQMRTRGKPAPN